MSNLVTMTSTALDAPAHSFFTPAQEDLILRTFLGGASREEAVVLLETVRRRRLDPFARQVYFVKRWDSQKREEVWAIQVSIDGLRAIAERTGRYDGQDEPVYGEDEAGKYCKVKVFRKDWSAGRFAVGIAYLDEFIQRTKNGEVTRFWREKPRLMLAKCAEALAIRKAFPEDAAGLYTPEELGDAPTPELPTQAPVVASLPSASTDAGQVVPAEVPYPAPAGGGDAGVPPPAPAPAAPKLSDEKMLILDGLVRSVEKKMSCSRKQAVDAISTAAKRRWPNGVPPKATWTFEDIEALELACTDIPF